MKIPDGSLECVVPGVSSVYFDIRKYLWLLILHGFMQILSVHYSLVDVFAILECLRKLHGVPLVQGRSLGGKSIWIVTISIDGKRWIKFS